MNLVRFIFVLSLLSLAACSPEQPKSSDTAAQVAHGQVAKIHWFDGSVEQGFELAKQQNKPVFLYWGAVWCPPCQEIKHTVFESKQFIAQTQLFVPIYLDGDTDRAQSWGEKFDVQGYPTMIVFNPSGEEITRIPGGIDISRYNTVLALSLNEMRPTTMLVNLALHQPGKLQPSDFVQLAYYSWGQDSSSLPEGTSATFFRDLSDKSTDPAAAARLYMEYLTTLARELDDKASDDTPEKTSTEAYQRLMGFLDSNELTLACWDYFGYYAEEIINLPVFSEEEAASLKKKWQERMLALRHDASLSTAEQLTGWLPLLNFHFMNEADSNNPDSNSAANPLPEKVIEDLKADLQAADKKTSNSFARQSVVSQMNYLYQSAKLFDDAKTMLLAELEKSASPYYFMSSLSSLAEKKGNIEEALEWRRKAYEASTGAATRFQWGASYIRTLVRLTPENSQLIMSTAMKLFDELDAAPEYFTGRNFRVLRSVNKQLAKWQSEQKTELAAPFQAKIDSLCAQQSADSIEQENCRSLAVVAAG